MKHLALVMMLAFCLASCHKPQTQGPAQTEDPVAVRIGDRLITQADIQKRLQLLPDKDQKFAQTPAGYQNLVQIITREKLIEADALHNQLDKDPQYQNFLRQKRDELDSIFNDFAQDLLNQMWYLKQQDSGALNVSDAEIKEYYDKYPYEMTIKQIIVDNAQTADEVLRSLKRAPSQWNALSRQYSIAPEELRTLTVMPGEYLPELEVVAATSAVGKVQGFFKTPLGFHIIMKTGEKRLKLEEAKPRIIQVLQNQKIDNVLEDLKTKYEVIIYEKND